MLSTFPELLFLSPIATTLLRIAVALVLFHVARSQFNKRTELASVPLIGIGAGEWLVWTSIVFDVVVGVLLLLGAYTQPAALAALIGVALAYVIARQYLSRIPLSEGVVFLTFVILASLVFTGPGAFAFDLPL